MRVRTNTHVYIPSVRLSVCLFADTHLSVCLSTHIPIKPIKASHLPSFCLSVCLRVCPSICLSSKRSQMMGWGGRAGGVFTCAIWHPQPKLNRVLNGRDTKWLQQSSCCKMVTDGSQRLRDLSLASARLRCFLKSERGSKRMRRPPRLSARDGLIDRPSLCWPL